MPGDGQKGDARKNIDGIPSTEGGQTCGVMEASAAGVASTAEGRNQTRMDHADGLDLAVALYDYDAEYEDELSFKTGDQLFILSSAEKVLGPGESRGETRILHRLGFGVLGFRAGVNPASFIVFFKA